jgi:hypothetical protein
MRKGSRENRCNGDDDPAMEAGAIKEEVRVVVVTRRYL